MSEPINDLVSIGEYHSFLVRLWQSHAQGTWHASAQSIQTGVTLHFADLAALFLFLHAQTEPGSDEDADAAATTHADRTNL